MSSGQVVQVIGAVVDVKFPNGEVPKLSLIHISEPTRPY